MKIGVSVGRIRLEIPNRKLSRPNRVNEPRIKDNLPGVEFGHHFIKDIQN